MRASFALDAAQIGIAVSCALLGSAIGAWYAGSIADRFGRVRTMQVAAVLLTVSAVGAGLAHGVWAPIPCRLIAGIGVGVASVIVPAYIAEVSPAHVRGRLGSLQQLAIVLGIFVALAADAVLAGAAGSAAAQFWLGLAAWRWMFIVAAIPAVVYGTLVLAVPESPRFLVARGESAWRGTYCARCWEFRTTTLCASRCGTSRRAFAANIVRGCAICAARAARAACCRWFGSASPVGLPAVRRHQRDLLLLLDALPFGRVQRSGLVQNHRRHVDHQRVGDAHRHSAGRSYRTQTAARHRLGRHDAHTRRNGLVFRARQRQRYGGQRTGRSRWSPRTSTWCSSA